YNTHAITILQDASPDGQHGRVMGVYVVSFFIWASFGTPLFGLAAGAFGPREMLAVSSLICVLAGGALLVLRPSVALVEQGPVETNELIEERP
ncbi:MAG: hypothetical protein ACK4V6_19795, partial [Microthrixaceae bacterium]